MKRNARRARFGWPVLLIALSSSASACSDDTPTATGGLSVGPASGDDATAGITTFELTTSSSGGVVDGTETTGDGSTTASDDTTTGGEALPGQTATQLVSGGTRASSRSYTVVYTLGQPSSLQSTHSSTNYIVQGGLIGANGSPP